MASVTQVHKCIERKVSLPFLYALLENKKEETYTKVFQVTTEFATEAGIQIRNPTTVISDFEMAIINAAKSRFDKDIIRVCLFHLCQNVYRKIQ